MGGRTHILTNVLHQNQTCKKCSSFLTHDRHQTSICVRDDVLPGSKHTEHFSEVLNMKSYNLWVWLCSTAVIKHFRSDSCSNNVLCVFSQCSYTMFWVFSECSLIDLKMFWPFSLYSYNVLSVVWVLSECSLSVLSVILQCSDHSLCTLTMFWVFSQGSYNLLSVLWVLFQHSVIVPFAFSQLFVGCVKVLTSKHGCLSRHTWLRFCWLWVLNGFIMCWNTVRLCEGGGGEGEERGRSV